MNIQLEVNKKVLDKIKEDNIPLNLAGSVLLILMALYHDNYRFLEEFSDESREKHVMLLFQMLLRKGYIREATIAEMDEELYKLTDKGKNFIQFAAAVSVIVKNTDEDDLENWIKEYNSLFPEPVRGQRNLRGDEGSCMKRMEWFLKKYKYTKEHILAAF